MSNKISPGSSQDSNFTEIKKQLKELAATQEVILGRIYGLENQNLMEKVTKMHESGYTQQQIDQFINNHYKEFKEKINKFKNM